MDRSLLLADIQKQELDRRHQAEIEKRKLDWRALSIDRKKWWEEWQAEFGETRQRQRSTQGSSSSGSGGGRAPSPALPRARDHFADLAKPPLPGRSNDPRKQVKNLAPKPADSRVTAEFTPAAAPDPAPSKAGWKKRRSAAERRADGSYKPRQRKGPSL
jgi:hypothetical protein